MLYYESFPLIGDFCPKPFGQFFIHNVDKKCQTKSFILFLWFLALSKKKMFWDSLLKSVHDMKYDALNGRICKRKSFMKNVVLRNWKKNSRNTKRKLWLYIPKLCTISTRHLINWNGQWKVCEIFEIYCNPNRHMTR